MWQQQQQQKQILLVAKLQKKRKNHVEKRIPTKCQRGARLERK